MGGSSQLHGEKGLEGTTFHNVNTKKGNSNTKSLAYVSLVCPILEYGAACWDPYREGQISALDRVEKKAAKFAPHTISPNGKLWRCAESYHTYVPSSKRTLVNVRGKLLVTDYNGHTI